MTDKVLNTGLNAVAWTTGATAREARSEGHEPGEKSRPRLVKKAAAKEATATEAGAATNPDNSADLLDPPHQLDRFA